jgi:hypothetical protein
MEQTRYLGCVTRASNGTWGLDCEQSTLTHPNGKVLIQCSCYNLSTPISLINDTDLKFFKETGSGDDLELTPPQYVEISKSGLLWLLIAIVVLWASFGWVGYKRDIRSLKRH